MSATASDRARKNLAIDGGPQFDRGLLIGAEVHRDPLTVD
jgi:hypothetical protein